jgi:hypothetical protein
MLRDRTLIWVLEYIFGGMLVIVPLAGQLLYQPARTDAHTWAARLFVVCLGVILVSCASSMRQRMLLSRRLDRLAQLLEKDAGSMK